MMNHILELPAFDTTTVNNTHTKHILNPAFDTVWFMQTIWGKQPLLIRNAFDFTTHPDNIPVSTQTLLSLAQHPDSQARLIAHKTIDNQQKWSVKYAPLSALPKTTLPNWTVLVQNLELHTDSANDLLRQFSFARSAELDDMMVSYATQGGGVGAHIDSYDVFLLQGQGQRRWRISMQTDLSLVPKLPLKILKHFEAEHEWVLNPGDMLYLPPNIAHEGTAITGECLTYSIGYRSPRLHDAVDDLLGMLSDSSEEGEGQIQEEDSSPQLRLTQFVHTLNKTHLNPAQLLNEDVQDYRNALNAWLNESVLEEHLGCLLTRPNRDHAVPSPKAKLNITQPLKLSKGTRILYSQGFVFIEGFAFAAEGSDLTVLSELANERCLSIEALKQLSEQALGILKDWLIEGWCTQ